MSEERDLIQRVAAALVKRTEQPTRWRVEREIRATYRRGEISRHLRDYAICEIANAITEGVVLGGQPSSAWRNKLSPRFFNLAPFAKALGPTAWEIWRLLQSLQALHNRLTITDAGIQARLAGLKLTRSQVKRALVRLRKLRLLVSVGGRGDLPLPHAIDGVVPTNAKRRRVIGAISGDRMQAVGAFSFNARAFLTKITLEHYTRVLMAPRWGGWRKGAGGKPGQRPILNPQRKDQVDPKP